MQFRAWGKRARMDGNKHGPMTRTHLVVRIVYVNVTDYNAFPVTPRTDGQLSVHEVAFVIYGEHSRL
jgi:hypothetical protein